MVLTGHRHRAYPLRAEDTGGPVREARCGTSTTRDYWDEDWGLPQPDEKDLPRNTVLIHRLREDEQASIVWETEIRRRDNRSGYFKQLGPPINFGRVWV